MELAILQDRRPRQTRRVARHPHSVSDVNKVGDATLTPDLNPIEQFFAKLKHWLRHVAKRTPDAMCNAIGHILGSVTSAECCNYFFNVQAMNPANFIMLY